VSFRIDFLCERAIFFSDMGVPQNGEWVVVIPAISLGDTMVGRLALRHTAYEILLQEMAGEKKEEKSGATTSK